MVIDSVAGGVPPGVTGIAWQAGWEDCTETDGQADFGSLPVLILEDAAEHTQFWCRFAWVLGDAIQAFGCACTSRPVEPP